MYPLPDIYFLFQIWKAIQHRTNLLRKKVHHKNRSTTNYRTQTTLVKRLTNRLSQDNLPIKVLPINREKIRNMARKDMVRKTLNTRNHSGIKRVVIKVSKQGSSRNLRKGRTRNEVSCKLNIKNKKSHETVSIFHFLTRLKRALLFSDKSLR